MATKGRNVLVLFESLAGTKHKYVRIRPKIDGPGEAVMFDPLVQEKVLYREIKKLKTMKDKKSSKSKSK